MVQSAREQGALFLPPGFRFHPTDEEVITSYLLQKFFNPSFSSQAVGEVDLNKCEPWDLPSKARMGEKEWYFFCQKDMKYPTGMRANRATKEGYWKATGKDKEIVKKPGGVLVGMKKTLVFYKGRAPKGCKTNWVMHEFRLEGKSRDNPNIRFNPKDEWVVCKVFHKKGQVKNIVDTAGIPKVNPVVDGSVADDFVDSLIDPAYFHSNNFSNTDYSAAVRSTKTDSILHNYNSFNTSNQVVHNSSIPTSSSGAPQGSSWNTLLPGQAHRMESYMYYQDDLVKALGGVVDPNFVASSKVLPSLATTGVQQQNSLGVSQPKLGSYGTTPYGSYLT